jgi:threonine/homoserine/homoserine lactone efflux protein
MTFVELILAIISFAISSTISPGPNSVLIVSSGVNFGIRKSVPLLLGICIGFSVMLVVVSMGFGQLFTLFPPLHLIIKILGITYLLYLAWLIIKSAGMSTGSNQEKPMGFLKGAAFQWINGKAWVVATSAVGAFTSLGSDYFVQSLTISLTFLLVSVPSMGIWLFFGTMLKEFLSKQVYRQRFNYCMALLLVLSIVPIMQEMVAQ